MKKKLQIFIASLFDSFNVLDMTYHSLVTWMKLRCGLICRGQKQYIRGEKTILVKTTGHEKSRFTVVLACLANGVGLKPMVIFKRKTQPKGNFPAGVVVHNQPKGWMDESGVLLWTNKVWGNRPGGLWKERSLLVFQITQTDS